MAPLEIFDFAGLGSSFTSERTNVYPHGSASAGLTSYGGLSFSSLIAPLYAYHLRVSIAGELVRAGRKPAQDNHRLYDWVPGTWLYGGELMLHFGHAMSECTHRLHAILKGGVEVDALRRDVAGVIFSSQSPNLEPYMQSLLYDYYGLHPSQIRIVNRRPAAVERIVHVPQASILGGSHVLPGYLDMLEKYQERNLLRNGDLESPRNLFISRRHIVDGGGQVLNEKRVADALSRYGFAEFRPEEHSLVMQLAIVSKAERIVIVGGSAIHLVEHLGRLNSKVFLIGRGDRDSVYHPGPLIERSAQFEQIYPRAECGDTLATSMRNGRSVSVVEYEDSRLMAALSDWLDL